MKEKVGCLVIWFSSCLYSWQRHFCLHSESKAGNGLSINVSWLFGIWHTNYSTYFISTDLCIKPHIYIPVINVTMKFLFNFPSHSILVSTTITNCSNKSTYMHLIAAQYTATKQTDEIVQNMNFAMEKIMAIVISSSYLIAFKEHE